MSLAMRKSSGTSKTRKTTPPSPTYMSNEEFASYLSNLRANRIARPGGARPLPPNGGRATPASRTSLAGVGTEPMAQAISQKSQRRTSSQSSSNGTDSISSRYSFASVRGRDYYPTTPSVPLRPSEVVPTTTYMERGQRWMEKEEAYSLRSALEDMDIQTGLNHTSDEESRIYNAALDEAAELVWQHQNGYKAPQVDGPYRYKPHLRKNSYAHARTASVGKYGDDIAPSGLRRDPASRSTSGSSANSSGSQPGSRKSSGSLESRAAAPLLGQRPMPLGNAGRVFGRRHSSLKRNVSGEVERPFSGDQIWEEPGAAVPDVASSSGVGGQAFRKEPGCEPLNRIDIHRNPPTQTRNPLYKTNRHSTTPGPESKVERKNGVEIRSDDIRAATSRRLKDRSSKLPEPTAVSDSPGRPIVSFDANWKEPESAADGRPGSSSTSAAAPGVQGQSQRRPEPMVIPHINLPEEDPSGRQSRLSDDVPSISIAVCDADPQSNAKTGPTIAVDEGSTANKSSPVTTPRIEAAERQGRRPLPSPATSRTQPGRVQKSSSHWSPAAGSVGRTTTTTCHECSFPIEGRFVALAGTQERFHPQCFSCFSCGTSLEAMEISPEPDQMRAARLERIRRRAEGEVLDDAAGMSAREDGDERLRFFCHLDWHELFAPRCQHCKTPIIGEHTVALGKHWHYGHFFCAECGDPFQHGMTHIEKDGYAWCVNCQTKRTERRAPKCKMCKTAVIGQYIQALGGEWHENCFRCSTCEGGFADGQIFTKEVDGLMVVMCTDCRMRDLKA